MATAELLSVDGEIMDPAEGTISVLDDGLLRGDGAFEVIKLYAGRPFALEDHLRRLAASAAAIELEFDLGALRSELTALVAERPDEDLALRLVVTRGGRRIATLERIPEWPETTSVATITYTPNEILTGVKSISYAANMQATRIAASRGAAEAVFVRRDGVVLEAPTSSIFWVDAEGILKTPAIETGILASITRQRLLDALGAETGSYSLDDLLAAGEAFLASTTREVQAIAAIDDVTLPGAPGPRTLEAGEALQAIVAGELA